MKYALLSMSGVVHGFMYGAASLDPTLKQCSRPVSHFSQFYFLKSTSIFVGVEMKNLQAVCYAVPSKEINAIVALPCSDLTHGCSKRL